MPLEPDARDPRTADDINAVVGGYLRDLAYAQASDAKMFGYKRAAAAILALPSQLPELIGPDGQLPRISGIGPGSTRIIHEVLSSGQSPTVEEAIDGCGRRADIYRRRALRTHFLSRAKVLAVLADGALVGPTREQYRGDLQMHSEWSDGVPSMQDIADACIRRGYEYAAVTDHSYGLPIAAGMSMDDAARQRDAIVDVNRQCGASFTLLQGIEANIGTAGELDLSPAEATSFDIVLAAPHSRLRRAEDQTARMLAAVGNPAVRILAHPRGRMIGSRAGVLADWDAVFDAAAARGVAIEIDGDPARQDLDYSMASRALDAGCLFAIDSDAHTTTQLAYAETALAHARLAGIPAERVINCWPLGRLRRWLAEPAVERPLTHIGSARGRAHEERQ